MRGRAFAALPMVSNRNLRLPEGMYVSVSHKPQHIFRSGRHRIIAYPGCIKSSDPQETTNLACYAQALYGVPFVVPRAAPRSNSTETFSSPAVRGFRDVGEDGGVGVGEEEGPADDSRIGL